MACKQETEDRGTSANSDSADELPRDDNRPEP
jgi:hypothetical protein